MSIHFHKKDLPEGIDFGKSVAVDTETQGLSMVRDKLCLVQLSAGDGDAHIVQMDRQSYDCPNLKALLSDPKIETIFHFARFDVADAQHIHARKTFKTHPECDSTPQDGRATVDRWDAPALWISQCVSTLPPFSCPN